MLTNNNFYFFKNASAIGESDITHNMQGETLTLQVDGTASSFNFKVMGCSDMASNNFYVLTGFKTDYDLVNNISANGLYTFDVQGVAKIKIDLTAIGGGSLTVFGKIIKGV